MTVTSNPSALFSPQSAAAVHKMRVLFVEDDDDCREALSAEFGDHGLEVESFRDGRSMLDGLATDANADVALLDWNLPDIPGIDLALELSRRNVDFPSSSLDRSGARHQPRDARSSAARSILSTKSRGVPVIVKRLRMIAGLGAPRPSGRKSNPNGWSARAG